MSRIRRRAKQPATDAPMPSCDALLDSIRRRPGCRQFAPERPVSIVVVGFALSCYGSKLPSELQKLVQTRAKRFGLHVIGVAAKARIAPRDVGRIRNWLAVPAQREEFFQRARRMADRTQRGPAFHGSQRCFKQPSAHGRPHPALRASRHGGVLRHESFRRKSCRRLRSPKDAQRTTRWPRSP